MCKIGGKLQAKPRKIAGKKVKRGPYGLLQSYLCLVNLVIGLIYFWYADSESLKKKISILVFIL